MIFSVGAWSLVCGWFWEAVFVGFWTTAEMLQQGACYGRGPDVNFL